MLASLEQAFGTVYPDLYHRLFDNGMLDWGPSGAGWYETVYPVLRKSPPLLLFAGDFRIIPVEDIESSAQRIPAIAPAYHALVPFARNGAGELYAFLYKSWGELLGIVQVNKHGGDAVLLARQLEDFVFRALLGAVVQINEDDLEDEATFVADIQSMLQSHAKYLTPGQVEILSAVYGRPIEEQEDGEPGMLSLDAYLEILDTEIGFPALNEKIRLWD